MSVPCPMSPGSTSWLPCGAAGTPGGAAAADARSPGTSPGGPSSLQPWTREHQPAPGARQLLHTLFSFFLLPRATWVTLVSLVHRDLRYCAWGGFLGRGPHVHCRLEAGRLLGRPLHAGAGRGMLVFGFLLDAGIWVPPEAEWCRSLRVCGAADHPQDARQAPATLAWLLSRYCCLEKWAGKPNRVFQSTEEGFLGGLWVLTPHWEIPLLLHIALLPCLHELHSALYSQGWK